MGERRYGGSDRSGVLTIERTWVPRLYRWRYTPLVAFNGPHGRSPATGLVFARSWDEALMRGQQRWEGRTP